MADNIPSQTSSFAGDQAALAAFVDQIIKDKNDPTIKPDDIPGLRAMLLDELNDRINTHMIAILPEEKRKGLEAILDKEGPDSEIDNFFKNNIPNLEAELAAVLLNFRAGFLASIKPGSLSPSLEDEYTMEEDKGKQPETQSTGTAEPQDKLMPAPVAPASHTPFDNNQIASDKAPKVEKTWN